MKVKAILGAGLLSVVIAGSVVAEDSNGSGSEWKGRFRVATVLKSYEEVPALSTPASGFFKATVDVHNETISYELSYAGIAGAPTQAHIHFGQMGVNGGVSVFLCANGTAPAGTPACPEGPATVTGTLSSASVVGPSDQGIAPGEFAELVKALREGVTYVNVHSNQFRTGEIRGQIDHPFKR